MATVTSPPTTTALDAASLRADFPLLQREQHGKRLVYLDSAASAQRPQSVLDAMDTYNATTHANVHRGVYTIAEAASVQAVSASDEIVHPKAARRTENSTTLP